MTISYKKLWIMLAEREMSKAELRRQAGLSPGYLYRTAPQSVRIHGGAAKTCRNSGL